MAEMIDASEPTSPEVLAKGPLLRIWTCGPLAIEWGQSHTPIPSDRFIGRGAVPALGLLKVLLSQPNRFAARDWLLDQFWPESTTSNAEERLHNVATHLRQLVRLSGSQEKFLHYLYDFQGHGGGYRLSDYPLIWVDADALAWNVKEAARFERFGEDALPLWERAYQLASRGEFLPEERYSDWATTRREEVAGQYRQSVHRYSVLLRERGATEQALLCLRSYWQQHLLDEDVLRSLMELLGEQERFQEAEEYYQRLVQGLQDDDLLDGEEPREPDARTQDLHELLRTKQLRRERKPTATMNGVEQDPFSDWTSEGLSRVPSQLEEVLSTFSEVISQGIIKVAHDVERIHMDTDRRDFLHLLGTSLGFAGLRHEFRPFVDLMLNGDQMALLENEATLRWKMYHSGKTLQTHEHFHLWLTEMEKCARDASSHSQKTRASSLLSLSYQLQGSLFRDTMNYQQAHSFYTRAFLAADAVDNVELKSSSLARRGVTFIQQQQPIEALQYLEAALTLIGDLDFPHLKGYIFQALSEAHAIAQHHDLSQANLDAAEQALRQKGNGEEVSNCQLNTTSITAQRGVNAVWLQEYAHALDLLNAGLDTYNPSLSRGRARLIAQKAEAYYGLGNIEESVSTAHDAFHLAWPLGSRKTIARVKDLYTALHHSSYGKERCVLQLGRTLETYAETNIPSPE